MSGAGCEKAEILFLAAGLGRDVQPHSRPIWNDLWTGSYDKERKQKRLLPQRVLHPMRKISPLWGWLGHPGPPIFQLSFQTLTGSSVIFNP